MTINKVSKCCEVITGKGQRCIQEGKYNKEGHLVCGLHQFTKRPIKYIPCKPEEEKVDIVTNILEKRFHDPIDIPCAYCEAAKEIVNLISPTLPSQELLLRGLPRKLQNPYAFTNGGAIPKWEKEYAGFEEARKELTKVMGRGK